MKTITETHITKQLGVHKVLLIPLIYAALVACGGGSGGTTSATPVAPRYDSSNYSSTYHL